ncbi:hypothetical protein DAPPUDRAFT_232921 [Daphnia pulex]|uniref:Uncharacterized protein n=1 Tax=Daphnia pulex TaxID=6669 RepID=E9FSQ1_DAPPU|nr:hypothetical protein DAPPUDRAFT_232921 [Daphnia pulex]|eukprot:EFX89238.1 hypothetical protein DAPPUDRAFT_232921 [Daphnia pulex]
MSYTICHMPLKKFMRNIEIASPGKKGDQKRTSFVVMSHRDVSSMDVSAESFKCQGRAIYYNGTAIYLLSGSRRKTLDNGDT